MCQSTGGILNDIRKLYSPILSVTQGFTDDVPSIGVNDDTNLSDAGLAHRFDGIVDHGLIGDRDEMLIAGVSDGTKSCSSSPTGYNGFKFLQRLHHLYPIHSDCFCFLLTSHTPVNDSCILYGLSRKHTLQIHENARPIFLLEQGEECLRFFLSKHPVGHGEDDRIVLGFVGFLGFIGFLVLATERSASQPACVLAS